MNHLSRSFFACAGLAIAMLVFSSCTDESNPLFSAGNFDFADGVIYDKTDGDNDGSEGRMNYNGYAYKVVRIGTQWWMAENLQATKYNDGEEIPRVSDGDAWSDLTTGGRCDYNNDPDVADEYGKIYNWFAVNTGKLAPPGWHVPSDAEWVTLRDYLGGGLAAGKPLKESGAKHWKPSNTGNNASGFTAFGAGGRLDFGPFYSLLDNAFFWASTSAGSDNAIYYTLICASNRFVGYEDDKTAGYSVRCVQD